ncbi:hypothetical protein GGS21DRAFT_178746 [Xylaria nigripes]|nr:hypothetical protein GGS21DRAFT_178746 [Xylaria nigripes]
MPDFGNHTPKKSRRVSFALDSSPKPSAKAHSGSATHSPSKSGNHSNIPNNRRNSSEDNNNNNNTTTTTTNNNNNNSNYNKPSSSSSLNPHPTFASTNPSAKQPPAANPAHNSFSNLFSHTVTNTPQGLIIDGVLHPRGPAAHSDPNDYSTSYPVYPFNTPYPNQPTMSTVGAGMMPNPNTAHYQPPVPDTTNGPFQYTYVPRTDQPCQGNMYPNGVPPPGGPAFFVPGPAPFPQAQPGVATAGIPIVPPGTQPPMPGQPINVQPGFVPPMNCAGAPFPAAVPGFAQPTPPVTPPGTYFVSGAHGGYEMGKTKSEVDAENRRQALSNQMYEPQGIKPADDDISRMYWTRELDGHWIPRSRCSLDTSGNFRWYVTENGVFYAVILRD